METFRVHVYATVRCPVEVQTENESITPQEVAEIAAAEFLNDADNFVSSPLAEYADHIDDETIVDEVVSKDETIYHGAVFLGDDESADVKPATVTLTVEELERLVGYAEQGVDGWEDDGEDDEDSGHACTKAEGMDFVDKFWFRIEAAKQ